MLKQDNTCAIPRTIPSSDLLSLYATYLLFAELGLGSLLHALRVPLTGYLLSLNQIFLLTRALLVCREKTRFLPTSISSAAALLKSAAPMGKKITPMLAIAMQGCLYNLGSLLLGNTIFGRMTGGALAALWGFAQPVLLYYFIFGSSLYDSLENLQKTIGFSFPAIEWTIIFIVILKVIFALIVVLAAPMIPQAAFDRYLTQLSKTVAPLSANAPSTPLSTMVKKAFLDMLNPFFLLSVGITASFLYASNSNSWVLQGLIRPIIFGFICFFLLRWINGAKLIRFVFKNKASALHKNLHRILEDL